MKKPILDLSLNDGEYRVILDESGLHALRYGQEWRSLTGDNLVLALASALDDARKEIKQLRDIQLQLDDIRKKLKQEQ